MKYEKFTDEELDQLHSAICRMRVLFEKYETTQDITRKSEEYIKIFLIECTIFQEIHRRFLVNLKNK